jgi:hypothetical protein
MSNRTGLAAPWLGATLPGGVAGTPMAAWSVWWLVLLTAAAAAASSFLAVQRWQVERAHLAARPQAPTAVQMPSTTDADPAQQLSALPRSDATVGFIESVAARLGVHVHRVQLVERVPTPAQLARLELQLELRGGYGDIKALLGEVAAKYASVTLSRLALQPLDSRDSLAPAGLPPADPMPGSIRLQAQVVWVFWGPPLPAEALAITARPAR